MLLHELCLHGIMLLNSDLVFHFKISICFDLFVFLYNF